MKEFNLRIQAANNLKNRALTKKVQKIAPINEQNLWSIAYWYGYCEALNDIKKTGGGERG